VVELIYQLRAGTSDADLFETQRVLLTGVLDAEPRRAGRQPGPQTCP
jgi:hypothetical protein